MKKQGQDKNLLSERVSYMMCTIKLRFIAFKKDLDTWNDPLVLFLNEIHHLYFTRLRLLAVMLIIEYRIF